MIFEKIQFEDDEQLLMVVRRHWFFLCTQCLSVVVLAILPLFGWLIIDIFAESAAIVVPITYAPHAAFLYVFWLLIHWMMLALIWTHHYLDIWAITNKRVIKIDQVSLFKRQVASFRLERLQDLRVEVNGIIETLLNYGTIHAETAGTHHEEFKAMYLPDPQHIKALILKAADDRIGAVGIQEPI